MTTPIRQDLHIYQGATWSYTYSKGTDLTGYSARMSIKGTYNGVLQAYLSTGSDADNGTVALGGSEGTVVLSMTAEQSAKLAGELNALTVVLLNDTKPLKAVYDFIDVTKPTAKYLYDLELVAPDGTVTRELQGHVIVHREITT